MNGSLGEVVAGYLDLRWRLDPVEGTFVGRHEHDAAYPRVDADSMREGTAALRTYAGALEEADADSLDEEIDRTAALHAARSELLVRERERPQTRDPSWALVQALGGLFLLLARRDPSPAERARSLLSRLQALPDFLRDATAALTQPDRTLASMAAAMLPGGVALVRDGLDDPSLDLASLEPAELDAARSAAVDALGDYGEAVERMAVEGGDHFAIGRDLFDRKVHTAHMIRENADELYRYGERLRAEATAQLERIAGEIAPGESWRALAERLRADTVSPADALSAMREATGAAWDFTAEHALVRIPPAALQVVPTPESLRSLIPFAAYQAPGAFDESQLGLFFVTVPEPGEPRQLPSLAQLGTTALHEAVPGHHLQMTTANRLPTDVRRTLATPATREGWALYCETLMVETGFLHTPEQRFTQARDLLWRAWRVILDVALHTRGMAPAEASRILQTEMGFDAASADAEVRRYCAHPTYQLCYAVGRREILALREDARRARGGAFDLAAFHDDLLSYGGLATALARWGMGLA